MLSKVLVTAPLSLRRMRFLFVIALPAVRDVLASEPATDAVSKTSRTVWATKRDILEEEPKVRRWWRTSSSSMDKFSVGIPVAVYTAAAHRSQSFLEENRAPTMPPTN